MTFSASRVEWGVSLLTMIFVRVDQSLALQDRNKLKGRERDNPGIGRWDVKKLFLAFVCQCSALRILTLISYF